MSNEELRDKIEHEDIITNTLINPILDIMGKYVTNGDRSNTDELNRLIEELGEKW